MPHYFIYASTVPQFMFPFRWFACLQSPPQLIFTSLKTNKATVTERKRGLKPARSAVKVTGRPFPRQLKGFTAGYRWDFIAHNHRESPLGYWLELISNDSFGEVRVHAGCLETLAAFKPLIRHPEFRQILNVVLWSTFRRRQRFVFGLLFFLQHRWRFCLCLQNNKAIRLMPHQVICTFVSACVTTEQKPHRISATRRAQVTVTVDRSSMADDPLSVILQSKSASSLTPSFSVSQSASLTPGRLLTSSYRIATCTDVCCGLSPFFFFPLFLFVLVSRHPSTFLWLKQMYFYHLSRMS